MRGENYPFSGQPFSPTAARWAMERCLKSSSEGWIKKKLLGDKALEYHIGRGGLPVRSAATVDSATAALRRESVVDLLNGFYRWKSRLEPAETYSFHGLPFSQGVARELILEYLHQNALNGCR